MKQKRLRLYTKSFKEIVNIVRGDGVTNPKRRRQDFQDDGARDFAMASERSRLKKALEESTCTAGEKVYAAELQLLEDLLMSRG
ncbi:hypothetical protein Tco_1365070 [Tanacetum coccineum]